MLPPKGEERARLLKENGKTAVGRSVNLTAGRSGNLGSFMNPLTKQEKQLRMAAVCAACTPEEQAAAAASAPPCADKNTATGYAGVYPNNSATNPYRAVVRLDGKQVSLGCFSTAEEAALCIARLPTPARKVAPKVEASAAPTAGTRSSAPPLPLAAVDAAPLLVKLAECLQRAELGELLR